MVLDEWELITLNSWRRIKKDFLYHFARPRVDMLVWIILDKLVPMFKNRVYIIHHPTGRARDVLTWRKNFKREWRKLEKRETSPPDAFPYLKYSPNTKDWTCACPAFVRSHFLVCKHLVRLHHRVPARFFLEVTRNRTVPFWSHPGLRDLNSAPPNSNLDYTEARDEATFVAPPTTVLTTNPLLSDSEDSDIEVIPDNDSDDESVVQSGSERDDDDDDEPPSQLDARYEDSMKEWVTRLREGAAFLEYQIQFRDARFLKELEREMARGGRFLANNLEQERLANSSRRATPGTWSQAPGTMWAHPRPPGSHCT